MKEIKFRTIDEAKQLVLPDASAATVQRFRQTTEFVVKDGASRWSKLKAIYEAADAITAEIAPVMVCQKGCHHCCKIDVGLLDVEAEYIGRNIKRSARVNPPTTNGYSENRTPCTFLSSDGTCGIYEYRPFACRTFYTLDSPAYCEQVSVEHATYDFKGNGLLKTLGQLLGQLNGAGRGHDIRDYFSAE